MYPRCFVHVCRQIVFRIVFFVRGADSVLFDSRLIAGLSEPNLNTALSRVVNNAFGVTYRDLKYTGIISSLFVYENRFTLEFTREVILFFSSILFNQLDLVEYIDAP